MRIIGGHDYYDSALAYGRDDDIVFMRKTELIDPRETSLWTAPMINLFDRGEQEGRYRSSRYSQDLYLIDKGVRRSYSPTYIAVYVPNGRYYGIRFDLSMVGPDMDFKKYIHTFWSYDAFKQWANSYDLEPAGRRTKYGTEVLSVEEYFRPMALSPTERSWMIANNIAIAIHSTELKEGYSCINGWDPWKHNRNLPWRCNSAEPGNALKDYDFMKAVDPFTLMQELSMYVGGTLSNTGPAMVKITDEKTLVKKHGFDKWSFRKMPAGQK